MKSTSAVRLLDFIIDLKLNFKERIDNIIENAYYKLYAFKRLPKFLT